MTWLKQVSSNNITTKNIIKSILICEKFYWDFIKKFI